MAKIKNTSEFIERMNARARLMAEARPQVKRRKPKQWREESLQEKCVTWFDYSYPELRMLLHHSPNEGRRSIVDGAHLKASGMRPGFPDLVLLMPSGEWAWLAMEFKSKGGRLSESQKRYAEYLPKHGVLHKVIWEFEEFTELIEEYLRKGNRDDNRGTRTTATAQP